MLLSDAVSFLAMRVAVVSPSIFREGVVVGHVREQRDYLVKKDLPQAAPDEIAAAEKGVNSTAS